MTSTPTPQPAAAPEAWFTFDGIYEAHITDAATAVRIAR